MNLPKTQMCGLHPILRPWPVTENEWERWVDLVDALGTDDRLLLARAIYRFVCVDGILVTNGRLPSAAFPSSVRKMVDRLVEGELDDDTMNLLGLIIKNDGIKLKHIPTLQRDHSINDGDASSRFGRLFSGLMFHTVNAVRGREVETLAPDGNLSWEQVRQTIEALSRFGDPAHRLQLTISDPYFAVSGDNHTEALLNDALAHLIHAMSAENSRFTLLQIYASNDHHNLSLRQRIQTLFDRHRDAEGPNWCDLEVYSPQCKEDRIEFRRVAHHRSIIVSRRGSKECILGAWLLDRGFSVFWEAPTDRPFTHIVSRMSRTTATHTLIQLTKYTKPH